MKMFSTLPPELAGIAAIYLQRSEVSLLTFSPR
jgi:hypothetical protein